MRSAVMRGRRVDIVAVRSYGVAVGCSTGSHRVQHHRAIRGASTHRTDTIARMTDTRIPSLGPRGEGWVAGQGVLLVAVAALGLPGLSALPPESVAGWATAVLGLAVMAGGLLIGSRALRDLGASLTAMPHPSEDAQFVDSGIYRLIRHPMYAALITTSLGWVLVTTSVPAAVATAALAVWLDLKSRREEAWLRGRYPEYEAYRRRTHRFIPGAY